MYETIPPDRPRPYPYTVFNAGKCDGLPRREPRAGVYSRDPIEEAEKVPRESGTAIENSLRNRACYDLNRSRLWRS